MATTRVNDIVFISSGGFPFTQEIPFDADFTLEPWRTAIAKAESARKILTLSRGADDDIGKNVATLMTRIREFANQRLETIGQVCLLGRSNGCALALALAAELNDQGINLTFVGISDLPMWDDGRKPPVPKVGDCKPINGVIASGAVAPNGGIGGFLSVGPVLNNVIPECKLSQTIRADKKVNLYQIKGNRMRYASSLKRWIWWSDFSGGEVHGKIDSDFEDRLRDANGGIFGDCLKFHIDLNTGKHWKTMNQEASNAFAVLPPGA